MGAKAVLSPQRMMPAQLHMITKIKSKTKFVVLCTCKVFTKINPGDYKLKCERQNNKDTVGKYFYSGYLNKAVTIKGKINEFEYIKIISFSSIESLSGKKIRKCADICNTESTIKGKNPLYPE